MVEGPEDLRQLLWLRTYGGESALQNLLEWSGISSNVSGFFGKGSIVRGAVNDETVIRPAFESQTETRTAVFARH